MKRLYLRKGHYYGGTVFVQTNEEWEEPREIGISWTSYGEYGAADISLDVHEAARLQKALGDFLDECYAEDETLREEVAADFNLGRGHGDDGLAEWEVPS